MCSSLDKEEVSEFLKKMGFFDIHYEELVREISNDLNGDVIVEQITDDELAVKMSDRVMREVDRLQKQLHGDCVSTSKA